LGGYFKENRLPQVAAAAVDHGASPFGNNLCDPEESFWSHHRKGSTRR